MTFELILGNLVGLKKFSLKLLFSKFSNLQRIWKNCIEYNLCIDSSINIFPCLYFCNIRIYIYSHMHIYPISTYLYVYRFLFLWDYIKSKFRHYYPSPWDSSTLSPKIKDIFLHDHNTTIELKKSHSNNIVYTIFWYWSLLFIPKMSLIAFSPLDLSSRAFFF